MRWRVLFWVCMVARAAGGPGWWQPAMLELRVSSGGKPVAARVYLQDAGGRPHTLPGAVAYSRGSEVHSIVEGAVRWELSPGAYRIRVEKGPEFTVAERTIELAPGQTSRVDMETARLVNMNAEGWYSGDLHIHRAPGDMPGILRAEDLNVAPVITRHVGSGLKAANPYPQTERQPVDETHVIGLQGQEVERNHRGHGAVLLLNTARALNENISLLFPTVTMFCRQARAEGGFIDAEKPIWRHVPVSVAFGLVDSIGVVNNHFHPRQVLLDAERLGTIHRDKPAYLTPSGFALWMMDLYYSFLNCGYRIAVSAGSASGVMPSWPGYERVYVHLGGSFGYRQWFEALRQGHSVATNGPLLRVTADGRLPGTSAEWNKPSTARLAVQIDSLNTLDRLEIVFNGAPVRTLPIGRKTYRGVVSVPIPKPGWLAVRCFERPGDAVRYAHSSPFYFPRNGALPAHAADARRWADFVRDLAAQTDAGLYPSQENYEQAMDELRQAEQIYRKLAAAAAGGPPR